MALPFDVANFNLVNFANAYNDLFDSVPKDVQIQLKDSNGNVTTKTVANRGKFKQQIWDDVGGALGQFDMIFYVDAENGDDNNNGSKSSPFKTISKAIISSAVGSKVVIKLAKGQNHKMCDYVKTLSNRLIVFTDYGNSSEMTKIRLTNRYVDNTDTIYYNYWILENSQIIFYNDFDFVIDDLANSNAGNIDGWRCFFRATKANNYVGAKNPKITLRDDIRFIKIDDYIGSSADLSFNTPTITTNQNTFLVELMYSAICSIKIKDTTNVDDISYLVAGILKDANGAYKNILTNLDI